jgi:hypothetical protein
MMPGPRTDKAQAWDAIEVMVKREQTIRKMLHGASDLSDVRHAIDVLKGSGRLDARQAWAVKKLLEAAFMLRAQEPAPLPRTQ